jgi:diaminopimelate decarboxylase
MRRIDQMLSVRDGRLYVEEVDCVRIANRFGTPLFVVSEDQLRRNARAFAVAFTKRWPEGAVRILPSLKANYVLALRHVLTQERMGCDTFGAAELSAALRANVPPGLISVNGSAKSAHLIEEAVKVGARITIDAARELSLVEDAARRLGKIASIRMRLRPDLSEVSSPPISRTMRSPFRRRPARTRRASPPRTRFRSAARRSPRNTSYFPASTSSFRGIEPKPTCIGE